MANRYARENFSISVLGPPVHDDFVWIGAVRDSASQTVAGNPGAFSVTPTVPAGTPLGDYLALRPAGP